MNNTSLLYTIVFFMLLLACQNSAKQGKAFDRLDALDQSIQEDKNKKSIEKIAQAK